MPESTLISLGGKIEGRTPILLKICVVYKFYVSLIQ